MKTWPLPPIWDAKKLATRYALNASIDFYVTANNELAIIPDIPDDPPIFEAPDPPLPTITSLINKIPMPLKEILLRLAKGE